VELSGVNTVNASRERVWTAINDPAVLQRCVPGLSGVTRTGNTVHASIELAFGRARGVYRGHVRVIEERPPGYARLEMEGQAPVGVLRGLATVHLEGHGGLTLVHWRGSSRLGGVLALIGQRVIEGAARAKIDAFFTRLNAELNTDPNDMAPGPARTP